MLKKDNVVKFDKTIEAVLALLLIFQSGLYLIISFEIVDPWVFPTSILFLASCGLGAVFVCFCLFWCLSFDTASITGRSYTPTHCIASCLNGLPVGRHPRLLWLSKSQLEERK